MTPMTNGVETPTRLMTLASHWFTVLAGIVPLAGLFAPRAIVPLIIASALIGLAAFWHQGRAAFVPARAFLVANILLVLWAATTTIWAIDAESAFFSSLRFAGNCLSGAVVLCAIRALLPSIRLRIDMALLAGWGFTVTVIVFELVSGGVVFWTLFRADYAAFADSAGPFWLTRGVAILTLLYWPLVPTFERFGGRILSAAAFVLLFVVAYEVRFMASLMALAVGALVALIVSRFGRSAAYTFAALVVTVSLAAPVAIKTIWQTPEDAVSGFEDLPGSARHRLGIWTFAVDHAFERPITGWGMNASRFIPGGGEQIVDLHGTKVGPSLPLHPHNATIQLWLELGAVGVVLFCLAFVALVRAALRSTNSVLLIGHLCAGLTLMNVSFGIWQAWWICALWFAAALALPSGPRLSVSANHL